ncbi:prepilin-type N-terminal cleavage/methylation domain-containing protein [Armatimonadetes bacterium GXS]|nr:Type II secretion system protein G [bacterium HR14]CUU36694.1 prepilin-type N-terminal cleavage/methylation domain-containing protein [Armatimonadetes bacterium GXS]
MMMRNLMSHRRRERGFTLVEIMIVVLIIGILLAIAVPSFMNARERSRANACRSNLRQIQAAKEQWAMATNQAPDATPNWNNLVPQFIQQQPTCPSGGTYTINDLSTPPACSITGHSL